MTSQTESAEQLPENQGLSKIEFRKLLQAEMKFKQRSHNTYEKTHAPELLKYQQTEEQKEPDFSPVENTQNLPPGIDAVLIGDSMLERLKTTGSHTRIAHLPSSFNAGVGGDKIENVLYRLDLGMMDLLESRKVKLWVVMIGTNNLRKTRPLSEVEGQRYRLLLRALLRIAPRSQILACEVFRRKDVDDEFVEKSNELLRGVVEEVDRNLGGGKGRICWMEAPVEVTKERLVDHVHLDREGYRIWDEGLYGKVEELLERSETPE